MARIEVLVERDPDAGDTITLIVDGVVTDPDAEHVVDPGAGWMRSDWDAARTDVAQDATLTPAFRQAVAEAMDSCEGSDYIMED
jgi:hypothetical protein